MKYAIVANTNKKECIEMASTLLKNIDAIVEKKTAEIIGIDGVPLERINVDVIITLGGDGTILLTLQKAKGKILGVNMGTLGFLSEIEPDYIMDAIEKIESGEYIVDTRMKIAVYLDDIRLEDCVNEAVIHTSEIAKLRDYKIYFNGELVDEIRADGIIISTPTGSTSYAFSAGGPVLHPKIEGIAVVPIAPFKYTIRAAVFPAEKIEVITPGQKTNLLVLDGQTYVEAAPESTIKIEKSENYAEFIRFDSSFFNRIRKMSVVR